MRQLSNILVTGGAGFIGSRFIQHTLVNNPTVSCIVNLDLLTYAGSHLNMAQFFDDPRHHFVHGDIGDQALVNALCEQYEIEAILHCAAESHVDNTIQDPSPCLQTNILGTYALLEVVRAKPWIHFHHVSTDEVYGSLQRGYAHEGSCYNPSSPYSASKAASDHLVRAWATTYGLSVTLSHCSNNYGPYQHREKLIPRVITQALRGEPIPVYGHGRQVRDWLYVDDHVEALWRILQDGTVGKTYLISNGIEWENLTLITKLLELLSIRLSQPIESLSQLIAHVPDRPGHDQRYALDSHDTQQALQWYPRHTLEQGLNATLAWYLHA